MKKLIGLSSKTLSKTDPQIKVHLLPALESNYIFALEDSKKNSAVVVDPGDAEVVSEFLGQRGLRLEQIWCTHHHWDHTDGVAGLLKRFSPKTNEAHSRLHGDSQRVSVYAFKGDLRRLAFKEHVVGVSEDDVLHFGAVDFGIIEIPGHTSGQVCFYSESEGVAFPGDTLFSLGCGRLFEGTPEQMMKSLEKLKRLPPDTLIYCGHEYTEKNFEFLKSVSDLVPPEDSLKSIEAQIKERFVRLGGRSVPTPLEFELRNNPFLRSDLETFTRIRELRNSF